MTGVILGKGSCESAHFATKDNNKIISWRYGIFRRGDLSPLRQGREIGGYGNFCALSGVKKMGRKDPLNGNLRKLG
jgi:hypothetical protein